MSLASASPDGEQAAIPPELIESVQRHQRHLAALVDSLRAAGVGEDVIEDSVGQLLDSYRAELTIAMRAMVSEKARD
ncbi:hypothetical protein ABVV53_16325 [Novosphingobium sp. RD2P27]|uniref:Uncharacterized protein n=1 Tax=Novosphingobium kalidii TaxID=3230299 RepID=A0ABV2D586_9SPHN